MSNLFRELRRREVFRTAGLYVGVAWILIEGASVFLPAFDAPEWVLRAMIIVAIIGMPVTVILAWIYDISDKGIEVQGDPTDTVVAPIGERKMDFLVIGVLSVALIFSVYLNFTGNGSAVIEEIEPISVLIADFNNETNQELFDGLLEQALHIGIESAPHITAYERNSAKTIATKLQPDSAALNPTIASLVAVREGINMVLAGSITSDGSGFDLEVAGVDPTEGRTLFEIKQKADSTEAVLLAVGDLSAGIRKELGDVTLDSESPFAETFTAASIDAARAYVNGGELALAGNYEAAVEAYQEAIRLDENFGRAYASLGLSAYRVGLHVESEQAWQRALSLMDTMTERERLRTLGVYYASVTRNYSSAIDSFSKLVEKYPADAPGHNNLAVVYFYTLDFDKARTQGEKILNIYPDRTIFRSNYALYAMYASEFDVARREAEKVVAQDAGFYKGYLPQAIAALDAGDFSTATTAYEDMKQGAARGASLAIVGLADANIYRGQFDAALGLLDEGIAADDAAGNQRAVATKNIIKAQALMEQGEKAIALEAARQALALDQSDATSVSAALLFIAAGDNQSATAIAERLSSQLQPQRRAYGAMLNALQQLATGSTVDAVDILNSALQLADLWLIRLQLGKAYLQAGYAAEAMAEFEAAKSRRGEATAIFLDDVPTFRYLAELPYWTALAQFEIGMTDAARENFESFLELRPKGGILVADARARLQ